MIKKLITLFAGLAFAVSILFATVALMLIAACNNDIKTRTIQLAKDINASIERYKKAGKESL